MPIIKSAKKRVRQAEKRLARNRIEKRALRDRLKAFNASLESKKPAEVEEAKIQLQSQIDKIANKTIHRIDKNTNEKKQICTSAQRQRHKDNRQRDKGQ